MKNNLVMMRAKGLHGPFPNNTAKGLLKSAGNYFGINMPGSVDYAVSGEFYNFNTFSSVTDAEEAWADPDRAQLQDDSHAGVQALDADGISQVLKCVDLEKKIPPGATVTEIKIRIDKYRIGATVVDGLVQLYREDVLGGDDEADGVTNWAASDTDTYAVYTGTTDNLWGRTWTPAQINNALTGVGIRASMAITVVALIDHVQGAVVYS